MLIQNVLRNTYVEIVQIRYDYVGNSLLDRYKFTAYSNGGLSHAIICLLLFFFNNKLLLIILSLRNRRNKIILVLTCNFKIFIRVFPLLLFELIRSPVVQNEIPEISFAVPYSGRGKRSAERFHGKTHFENGFRTNFAQIFVRPAVIKANERTNDKSYRYFRVANGCEKKSPTQDEIRGFFMK